MSAAAEAQQRQASGGESDRREPSHRRPDALRAILVDPGPSAPRPRAGQLSGLWLPVAVVVSIIADGAMSVWFQRENPPAPVATRVASAPDDPAVEQGAATSAPGEPEPAPAPQATVLDPVAVTPEPEVADLMQRALELEAHDPPQAALGYTRAAIRGHPRAAYYLGQFYETGTGVEPSRGMARLWYAAAGDLPAARRRLQALSSAVAVSGTPAAPSPIFQARLSTGGSEMIWRVPEGVAPVRFRVETFGPADEPLPAQETTVPGLVVPEAVSAWRVIAIGADGVESVPSPTVTMIPPEG